MQIWLFGGIERVSKRFAIALTGEVGDKRDKATLVPLIQIYIYKGSIIYSDCWGAFTRRKTLSIQLTKTSIPKTPSIHLWLHIKTWIRRPGIRSKCLNQYLARNLFITSQNSGSFVHNFLKEAARL